MNPCPRCAQPDGFHAEACGHLIVPPDWELMELMTWQSGITEATWLDARGKNHTTSFITGYREELGVKPPAWAR